MSSSTACARDMETPAAPLFDMRRAAPTRFLRCREGTRAGQQSQLRGSRVSGREANELARGGRIARGAGVRPMGHDGHA